MFNLHYPEPGKDSDGYAMDDLSEHVALVGRGEHEHDDDEATLAPRKLSEEDVGDRDWKSYTSTLRENVGGHSRGGSYTSLATEEE